MVKKCSGLKSSWLKSLWLKNRGWRMGLPILGLKCPSTHMKILHDVIICGLRNGTIEIWNKKTLKKELSLEDQHGSVQVSPNFNSASLTEQWLIYWNLFANTGDPRISWFQNSWSSLFNDSVSGTNFMNSPPFRDFQKKIIYIFCCCVLFSIWILRFSR